MSRRIRSISADRERLQETDAFTSGPASESHVPIPQSSAQLVAQISQVKQLRFNVRQFLGRKSSHLLARRSSLIANLENSREFVERESYRERATHKLDSLKSFGWILTITIGQATGTCQYAFAFVMT